MVRLREVIVLFASLFSLFIFFWIADFSIWAIVVGICAIAGAASLAVWVSKQ